MIPGACLLYTSILSPHIAGLQYYMVTELSVFPRNGLSVRAGSADPGRHSG